MATLLSLRKVDSIQEAIKQYNSNVSRIADLQTRLLNVLDQNTSRQTQAQLDGLTADTRSLGNTLRERIKKLATWPAKGRDAEIRKNQVLSIICRADGRPITLSDHCTER